MRKKIILSIFICGIIHLYFYKTGIAQTYEISTNQTDSIVKRPPSPTTIGFHWQPLKPQKIEVNICENSGKRMVLVYSDVTNFVLQDGDEIISPVSSVPFINEIKQNTFCLKNSGYSFGSHSIAGTNNEVAAFLVSRDEKNLSEMAALIEETLNKKPTAKNEISVVQVKTAEKKEMQISKTETTPNKEISTASKKAAEISPVVQKSTRENSAILSTEGEYGYKIQLMAKSKKDFTQKSVEDYFKIPYKINIEREGGLYRFTIGPFDTLELAQNTLVLIHEKYRVKEKAFIALYKNGTRICLFPESNEDVK